MVVGTIFFKIWNFFALDPGIDAVPIETALDKTIFESVNIYPALKDHNFH